jgi:hypothetical protein
MGTSSARTVRRTVSLATESLTSSRPAPEFIGQPPKRASPSLIPLRLLRKSSPYIVPFSRRRETFTYYTRIVPDTFGVGLKAGRSC